MEPNNLALDRWLLSLTDKDRPRVLFVPTASGDSDNYVQRFFTAYTSLDCQPAWLPLFRRTGDDVRAAVGEADLIFVGGGNTANMLAIWRTHGVDVALREAWEADTVMAGLSAGAICWFEQGGTDSFGLGLAAMDCLGELPRYRSVPVEYCEPVLGTQRLLRDRSDPPASAQPRSKASYQGSSRGIQGASSASRNGVAKSPSASSRVSTAWSPQSRRACQIHGGGIVIRRRLGLFG